MDFTPNWKEPNCDLLVQAILSLQNEEDVYRFLDDLCTITEIKAMSQRINVAKLLSVETTYNEVARETGASTATISRVKRCLNYGADGYKRVLIKMQKESGHEK
ncbi:MAG: DNA-binding transcriptional regulator [Firmicutes bacterium HGW-Firmicutes-15]|nr:MAG: DNA-binding transcriptional regulator [Firmicutes bacterium HGW-Firmicutes-15]